MHLVLCQYRLHLLQFLFSIQTCDLVLFDLSPCGLIRVL
ncbi:Uncharacterised protein [Vibrio cholerae]|nr:Uncharacterised protein [Vibrio cholerae]CSI41310.1 Uncharacterised protein [Vibrio cholerae]